MATIGIDAGACHSVMAVAAGGKLDIIRNDISERLTPSLVAFTDEDRRVGDPALSTITTNLRNTCRNMKMLMGLPSSELARESKFALASLVPMDRGLIGYEVTVRGEKKVFSSTGVAAAHLAGLKALAERSLGTAVAEAVIAVPTWFNDVNIQALRAAAAAAGLTTLRFFSEHAAVSLDYGIFRASQFSEKESHRVLFVNSGYTSTTVFVSHFLPGDLKVVHAESDTELGGRNFDEVLAAIIADHASKKFGVDVRENPKTRYKIESQAAKTKKVLSANTDTTVSVEGIYEDHDLQLLITRDQFVHGCARYCERLRQMVQNALAVNGENLIHAVELVGGCARIPWVQEVVEEELKNALPYEVALRRTLNQDETVAKGCALQAAMLSRRFKVRDYKVNDCAVYPLDVSWTPDVARLPAKSGPDGVADDPMDGGVPRCREALVRSGDIYPKSTWISFPVRETLQLSLATTAPPGRTAAELEIGRYEIDTQGVDRTKLTAKAKLKVKVDYDLNRSAEVTAYVSDEEEYVETVAQKRPIATPPPTEPPADAAAPPAEAADGAAAAPPVQQFETVQVEEKRTRRVAHKVRIARTVLPCCLSTQEIQSLREKEIAMEDEDRQWRERRELMNELEATIYDLRDKIQYSGLGDYICPEEKDQFVAKLNVSEEWIYDKGYDAQKSEITAQLNTIRETGLAALRRAEETKARPVVAGEFAEQLRQIRTAAQSPDESLAHIPVDQKDGLTKTADELELWLQTQLSEQAQRPLYLDPCISATEIRRKIEEFRKEAERVLTQPKPQPPPAESTPPAGTPSTAAPEEAATS